MYNKNTTALYAAVIASVLVASVLAISYVQMALAQSNQTQGNQTSGGAAGGTNRYDTFVQGGVDQKYSFATAVPQSTRSVLSKDRDLLFG